MTKIIVTWKKSTIGFPKTQRKVIESLGLRRLNHAKVHEDTPSIRGMVHKVRHLVEITKLSEPSEK